MILNLKVLAFLLQITQNLDSILEQQDWTWIALSQERKFVQKPWKVNQFASVLNNELSIQKLKGLRVRWILNIIASFFKWRILCEFGRLRFSSCGVNRWKVSRAQSILLIVLKLPPLQMEGTFFSRINSEILVVGSFPVRLFMNMRLLIGLCRKLSQKITWSVQCSHKYIVFSVVIFWFLFLIEIFDYVGRDILARSLQVRLFVTEEWRSRHMSRTFLLSLALDIRIIFEGLKSWRRCTLF